MEVELRDVERADLSLLDQWLSQAHVRPWFGDKPAVLNWAQCPPPAGSQAMICRNVTDVGYIRWQSIDRHTLDSLGFTHIPDNSVDVDILLGRPSECARGTGPTALRQLAAMLQETGAVPLIALTTSVDNFHAQRAFLKAGFVMDRQYTADGFGDCYLYTRRLLQH